MKKRILSLVLVIIMAVGLFPSAAFAIEIYTSGDWVYFIDGEYVKINKYLGSDTEVIVPAVIDGYNITHIHTEALARNEALEKVTISDGIEYIGSGAFSGCTALTDVTIPSSVTHIIQAAFSGCSSLTQLEIPYGVEQVGWAAFCGSAIESIAFPESVTEIGANAFEDCTTLKTVSLPRSLGQIGNYAFKGCTGITQVHYAGNRIEYFNLSNTPDCENVTYAIKQYSFNISDTVFAEIDEETGKLVITGSGVITDTIPYYLNDLVTNIEISQGITALDNEAFRYFRELKTITLPDSITYIGTDAFEYCQKLERVDFGGTLEQYNAIEIGEYNGYFTSADTYCDGVHIHYFDDDTDLSCNGCDYVREKLLTASGSCGVDVAWAFDADTGTLTISGTGDMYYLFTSPWEQYKSQITTVVINEGVTSIGGYAFYNCSSLTSITIPEGVTSIGDSAFRGCSGLTSITIPEGVTLVDGDAFRGCSGLTSIIIPEGVTSIGGFAFFECSNLEAITIPSSVTSIGQMAFYNCSSLTSITIPNSVTSIGDDAFFNCSSLTSITIPDSVTSIGGFAFDGCSSLTSITIPDSVTSIGEWAFYNCSSLTSITIPDSVTLIGIYAFCNCSSLTSITIPEGVTSIGWWAFSGCSSLTSITIPDSVTLIDGFAFNNCSSLTSITIPNSVTSIGDRAFSYCSSLTSITIPDSVTLIGIYAFYNCSSLTSITIPEGVTSISYGAFSGCSSLTSITIPNSVTSIGEWAFRGCSSLTSITIPDSVTSIGEWAFSYCSSLKKIALSTGMTMIEERTFSGSGIKVLYLPKEITLIKSEALGNSIKYVYYNGSEQDRENLTILSNNDSLKNATWVYNATGLPACEYTNDCDSQCNLCGGIRLVEGHKYTNACDTSCNVCGATRTTTHSFSAYVYNNNATTSADGTKTRTCSVCGHSETVVAVGTKLPTPQPQPTPQPTPTPQPQPTPQPTPVEKPIYNTTKIFTDVVQDWYTTYVDYAYSYEIFKGNEDKTFKPLDNITRAEFVQVLANITGVDTSNKNITQVFIDVVSGDWFAPAVMWAYNNGIVAGYGAEFKPYDNITREQMCVMIVNYAKFKGITLKVVESKEAFVDDAAISSWAKDAVYACQMADIVNGKGEGRFDPAGTGLRAEASVIFTKFHQNYLN